MKTLITILSLFTLASPCSGQWQYGNSTALGTSDGNYLWQTGVVASSTNYFYQNTWLYRNGGGGSWNTTQWVDGISVDISFQTPTTARSWWKRDAYNNVQSWGDQSSTYLTIAQGNVGIGTASPDQRLTVNGKIKAEEIQVVVDVPADYVFGSAYKLMPLKEVAEYVKEKKHLPGVPNGQSLIKNGWQVGEMNNKLLEKIEELTLYVIEQQEQMQNQQKEIESLKSELVKIKRQRN